MCVCVCLTFDVFKLPLLPSESIDCCREEIAAEQLLAKGSIFCEMDKIINHTSSKVHPCMDKEWMITVA